MGNPRHVNQFFVRRPYGSRLRDVSFGSWLELLVFLSRIRNRQGA